MSFFVSIYFLFFSMIFQLPGALAKTCAGSCSRMSFNVKNVIRDRALEGDRRLKNMVVENDPQCFSECSKDCKCLSFNVCGKTCQLNQANRMLARNSFRVKVGCRYYDMPIAKVRGKNILIPRFSSLFLLKQLEYSLSVSIWSDSYNSGFALVNYHFIEIPSS